MSRRMTCPCVLVQGYSRKWWIIKLKSKESGPEKEASVYECVSPTWTNPSIWWRVLWSEDSPHSRAIAGGTASLDRLSTDPSRRTEAHMVNHTHTWWENNAWTWTYGDKKIHIWSKTLNRGSEVKATRMESVHKEMIYPSIIVPRHRCGQNERMIRLR